MTATFQPKRAVAPQMLQTAEKYRPCLTPLRHTSGHAIASYGTPFPCRTSS